jgi:hypothetical protein
MYRHKNHRDSLDAEFDALLLRALESYRLKQDAFEVVVTRFSQWSIDDEQGTLEFSAAGGQSSIYSVTPVATYLPEQEDWAWAWANDAFPSLSRSKSARIKELSLKTEYKIFTTPYFRASTTDIDELCALALQELNGLAVFKIKNQEPWSFYVVE